MRDHTRLPNYETIQENKRKQKHQENDRTFCTVAEKENYIYIYIYMNKHLQFYLVAEVLISIVELIGLFLILIFGCCRCNISAAA